MVLCMVTRIGPTKPLRNYIRQIREKRGLTQEQLADRVGTYKGQISNWENAKRSISPAVQHAVAQALDVEPGDLFRDPARPSADELLRNVTDDIHREAIEHIKLVISRRSGGK